ncbi:MAG: glycosyltransferase, partial [Streptosporangiaceae bacterium]
VRAAHLLVVVCSADADSMGSLKRHAARSGLAQHELVLTGFVPDEDLVPLYSLCRAFCFPSLAEGFGLPVLEAMARGKVVVAAKASSLPEVGGDAALYFHEAADPGQLAQVLEVALGDQPLRKAIAKAARERARAFSWDRCAAGVAAVVRELV